MSPPCPRPAPHRRSRPSLRTLRLGSLNSVSSGASSRSRLGRAPTKTVSPATPPSQRHRVLQRTGSVRAGESSRRRHGRGSRWTSAPSCRRLGWASPQIPAVLSRASNSSEGANAQRARAGDQSLVVVAPAMRIGHDLTTAHWLSPRAGDRLTRRTGRYTRCRVTSSLVMCRPSAGWRMPRRSPAGIIKALSCEQGAHSVYRDRGSRRSERSSLVPRQRTTDRICNIGRAGRLTGQETGPVLAVARGVPPRHAGQASASLCPRWHPLRELATRCHKEPPTCACRWPSPVTSCGWRFPVILHRPCRMAFRAQF
jgi:hypothetical protein